MTAIVTDFGGKRPFRFRANFPKSLTKGGHYSKI